MNRPRLVKADGYDTVRGGLGRLLLDSVASGASVGFLANIDATECEAYLDEVSRGIQAGKRLLWVIEEADELLGSVQLALVTKPNGLNRAEIQKLLVHQRARRRGLASTLMAELEAHSLGIGRGLLYLDTLAGSDAEALYARLGYVRVGEIPDYAAGPDGTYQPTALYYKILRRAQ
ncbi:GNAT family N-acetyltransferase [Pseudomonas sp. Marseille-QA0892]